jgi:hypothetical protein
LVLGGDDGRVVRLAAPDFTKAADFITRNSAKVASGDRFASIAVNPQGDVYLADFDGGVVLDFGADGMLKGTFFTIPFPNQMVFDSSGKLYLTNQVFFGGGQTRGGVLIVTPQGQATVSLRIDKARGIAVCER